MIKFACSCQTVLEVSDAFAGSSLQCPKCRRLVDVPALSDLASLTEDGTFKLEPPPVRNEPERLADLQRAFAPGRIDKEGNEIDLRQNYHENAIPLEEDDVLEVLEDQPIPHKYDPVTGELIRDLPLQQEPVKFDPNTIPMAKAVINYASGDTSRKFSGWRIIPELFKFPNLFVIGIIFCIHILLQLMMAPMWIGMLLILPGFIVVSGLMLSHYSNVVEDVGVEQSDELPRPLRNVSLYDDLWAPFQNFVIAAAACYAWVLFVHRIPTHTGKLTYVLTVLVMGTIAFPAVFLTTTTSGTVLNLAPHKLLRLIGSLGVRYLIAVLLWIVTGTIYVIGIVGSMLALAALLTDLTGNIGGLPFLVGYAALIIGTFLMHAFCWYLGLQYRNHYEEFDWYLQRHQRRIEMIKSPTGNYVPAPSKPVAPVKPPPIPAKAKKPTPVQALPPAPPSKYPQSHA